MYLCTSYHQNQASFDQCLISVFQDRIPWKSGRLQASPSNLYRPYTAAPSTSRPQAFLQHSPLTSRAQPLSCRQLLQQRLQKYSWSATFNAQPSGPQHNQCWKGVFQIGEITVGISGWETSKDKAKEEAARAALVWMNQYGYH